MDLRDRRTSRIRFGETNQQIRLTARAISPHWQLPTRSALHATIRFVDGNKRAAFASIIVFLGLNGFEFDVPPEQATAIILALAAGEVSEESLTRWIKDNWPNAETQLILFLRSLGIR